MTGGRTAPSLRTATSEWELWSTRACLVVTDGTLLGVAREVVEGYLSLVDDAANRFREDSEIRRLGAGTTSLSPVLTDLLQHALLAAELTEGDVDPTVGQALRRLGYDRDLRLVLDGGGLPVRAQVRPVPGYRTLTLRDDRLTVPAGIELDLGATAKAVAADRAAALVHQELGTGVLVSLGGDVASAGPPPAGGWQVRVQDRTEDPVARISLPAGAAVATSSTVNRRWRRGGRAVHHIVDPRTSQPATAYWRSVTVVAGTCAAANAVSTASIIRGDGAPAWVGQLGLAARFLRHDGVVEQTAAWPE
ncbi:MAG: FAD:protein transferase [Nocardioidaceae bacterium]|nr:FAD:protein transferase [Nocardioidaceae bacterium]